MNRHPLIGQFLSKKRVPSVGSLVGQLSATGVAAGLEAGVHVPSQALLPEITLRPL